MRGFPNNSNSGFRILDFDLSSRKLMRKRSVPGFKANCNADYRIEITLLLLGHCYVTLTPT